MITVPPVACKICIKCVKIVFHTLSLNSCKRSTTNIRKKLNSSSMIWSEKAFCHSTRVSYVVWRHEWCTFTATNDSSARILWTPTPFRLAPCWKISFRASVILFLCIWSSTWICSLHISISAGIPMFSTATFSAKHWGHRQTPRNLIQATRILEVTIRQLWHK